MNRFTPPLLYIGLLAIMLSSCASMTPATARRAYCNTLKSHVVFNGSTSITREANIQESEKPLQESNYEEYCQ